VAYRENLVRGGDAADLYEDDSYLDTPYFEALKVGAPEDVEPYLVYRRALARLQPAGVSRRLLDVGAAYGAFLEQAERAGWNATGVEISQKAAAYAIRERHAEIFVGTLDAAAFPDASFAAVTLWDVIEHLDDPLAMLREIHRILEPGGVLVVFTINQKSLINRVGHFLHWLSPRLATRPLVLLYDIHHNFFFDRETLTALLRRSGFTAGIAWDHLAANIDRWQNVRIPPLLSLGTKVLDQLGRLTGQHYRMIAYATKSA
jgi:SAM-dependent methyltransferase